MLTSYTSPSSSLGSVLTGGNLWFHGTNAMTANGGGRVKMYAPSTWASGSSYSHLDYTTFNNTANQLMVYAISAGEAIHDPGPVTEGLLKDLGWTSATSCTYSISPTSRTVDGSSGTGSVSVTVSDSSCTWTASSNAAWITVTSGTPGTGSGTVGYSFTANNTGAARTGTITIAGKTFTITQKKKAGLPWLELLLQ